MTAGRPLRAMALALVGAMPVRCGDGPAAGPTPQQPDGAYIFTVMCSNCPGLTNVEIDRSVVPHRARLARGRLTSLRAAAVDGCGAEQVSLQVVRWVAGDPTVIAIEPSSTESAIVTALEPGVSRVLAQRQLPDGSLTQLELRDAFLPHSGCAALPEVVFEIVP